MKKTTLVFFLWIFFMALTIMKIIVFSRWFLILMFIFCVITYYIMVHNDNRIRNIPKPVYLADPE